MPISLSDIHELERVESIPISLLNIHNLEWELSRAEIVEIRNRVLDGHYSNLEYQWQEYYNELIEAVLKNNLCVSETSREIVVETI